MSSPALFFSDNQVAANEVLARRGVRYSCLFGGARSGKSFLIVRALLLRALKAPRSRHVILRYRTNAVWAAIAGDQNATLFSVARMCFPGLELIPHRMDGYFELPNGSTIRLGGLDEKERVDKILGQEFASIYLNEASEISWQSATTALTRLAEVVPGIAQRAFVDLNPVGKSHWTNRLFVEGKNPVTLQPIDEPEKYAHARLNPGDNRHNLTADFIKSLEGLPEKQRKRFFEGVFVDEVEGALWTYDNIEKNRRSVDDIPVCNRAAVVVAIDPSGAKSDMNETADEIGIIVVARGTDGEVYVLADRSLRDGPREWARQAVTAYHEFGADSIVAEANFGGGMVESTIKVADPQVPVRLVTASRGKAVRAEPVSELYQLGQVHHTDRFMKLEDQLCQFSGGGYQGHDSPDHADALVWAVTHLMLGRAPPQMLFG